MPYVWNKHNSVNQLCSSLKKKPKTWWLLLPWDGALLILLSDAGNTYRVQCHFSSSSNRQTPGVKKRRQKNTLNPRSQQLCLIGIWETGLKGKSEKFYHWEKWSYSNILKIRIPHRVSWEHDKQIAPVNVKCQRMIKTDLSQTGMLSSDQWRSEPLGERKRRCSGCEAWGLVGRQICDLYM